MPVVDVAAKQTGDMIRALSNGNKIKEVIEECRDKNGKLDEGFKTSSLSETRSNKVPILASSIFIAKILSDSLFSRVAIPVNLASSCNPAQVAAIVGNKSGLYEKSKA